MDNTKYKLAREDVGNMKIMMKAKETEKLLFKKISSTTRIMNSTNLLNNITTYSNRFSVSCNQFQITEKQDLTPNSF